MKIAVVGVGNVGMALGKYLTFSHEVIGIDIINKEAPFPIYNDYQKLKDVDIVFISLPTSYDEKKKSLDTSVIKKGILEVFKYNKEAPIFIKSTVNVGFTRQIAEMLNKTNIYFTPEFLRQDHADEDVKNPDRLVIGTVTHDDNVAMYFSLFDCEHQFEMSYEEAEATKLFANTYLATRIAFFNELDSYSEINGLDSSKIIKATVEANDVRKNHIVSQILKRLEGEDDPLVAYMGFLKSIHHLKLLSIYKS